MQVTWLIWAAISAIAVVDILWIGVTPWAVSPSWLCMSLLMLIFIPGVLIVAHLAIVETTELVFFHSVLQCIAIVPTTAVLSYLLASVVFPLVDARLLAVDRLLGFDWTNYVGWLNGHPQLAWLMSIVYRFGINQIFVAVPLVFLISALAYIQHFVGAFFICAVATIGLSTIWPAVGAYVYFHIDLAQLHNLQPSAAFAHLEPLARIRDGRLRLIGDGIQGLVTFPSFHASMAVLMGYVAWPLRPVRLLVFLVNGLMVVSAIGDGGHYLVDVIGGVAIAAAALWAMRILLPTLDGLPEGTARLRSLSSEKGAS